jgi:holin-like protein
MIMGLLILLFFQAVGELTSWGLGLFIPGPVMGMVYFFIGLLMYPPLKDRVLKLSRFINSYLALFFVPAGVGLIEYFDLFGRFGTAMMITLILSTVITMLFTAWIFNRLLKYMPMEKSHD